MKKKVLKKISSQKVRIFKITNRRGYGAICLNNLTEGTTPNQAYLRMIKALKRIGFELPIISTEAAKKRVIVKI